MSQSKMAGKGFRWCHLSPERHGWGTPRPACSSSSQAGASPPVLNARGRAHRPDESVQALRRVFERDSRCAPCCGGAVRVIAAIIDAAFVARMLERQVVHAEPGVNSGTSPGLSRHYPFGLTQRTTKRRASVHSTRSNRSAIRQSGLIKLLTATVVLNCWKTGGAAWRKCTNMLEFTGQVAEEC